GDLADNTVGKVTEKAKESVSETKDRVEKILDTSVNHSLNRIGLVTPKDLQHIEQLLVQLHIKVDALIEENQHLKEKLNKK
ncbi:phasin family protein, partial [Acinetobacter sp. 478810]